MNVVAIRDRGSLAHPIIAIISKKTDNIKNGNGTRL